MPFVYLLRCSDDSLYCGWTTDVDRRLAAHRAGNPQSLHKEPTPGRAGGGDRRSRPLRRAARGGTHQAAFARGQARAGRRPGLVSGTCPTPARRRDRSCWTRWERRPRRSGLRSRPWERRTSSWTSRMRIGSRRCSSGRCRSRSVGRRAPTPPSPSGTACQAEPSNQLRRACPRPVRKASSTARSGPRPMRTPPWPGCRIRDDRRRWVTWTCELPCATFERYSVTCERTPSRSSERWGVARPGRTEAPAVVA